MELHLSVIMIIVFYLLLMLFVTGADTLIIRVVTILFFCNHSDYLFIPFLCVIFAAVIQILFRQLKGVTELKEFMETYQQHRPRLVTDNEVYYSERGNKRENNFSVRKLYI